MKLARSDLAVAIPIFLISLVSTVNTATPAPAGSEAPSYTVTIKDFQFAPRNLEVPVGSKVTWINKDEEPHKVAEVNNAFISQPLDTDQSFSYQFKSPGRYAYFCTLHPHMTGAVVVESK